ncbi:MAG: CAP domain-containing protein [Limisphaerales bacterium]
MSFRGWTVLWVLVAFHVSAAESVSTWTIPLLGEAPRAPRELIERGTRGLSASGPPVGYRVDVGRREEVRNFYNTVYLSSEGLDAEWTGRYDGCDPGSTSIDHQEAVFRRINYFRALAGLPAAVERSESLGAKAQQAALIMSAAGGLSHDPPPGWACYTIEGDEAAGSSNLALGTSGPESIVGYMEDYGGGNSAVGHRRWILYPQTRTMGTGDVPGDGVRLPANATWVFDGNFGSARPETRDTYVAWPPPGFVPYSQIYTRWSFSHPGADFGSASVTLSSNSVPLNVRLEPFSPNVGEPTLVWHILGANTEVPARMPKPAQDIVFSVEIRGVRVEGGTRTFAYDVRAFDPAVPGPDHGVPVIAGSASIPVGVATTYSFTSVAGAETYEWRQAARETGTVTEGAESGAGGFEVRTTGDYEVVVPSPVGSGRYAFHLAHPGPPAPQILRYGRGFLVGATSELRFKSRLGWASSNQRASVQVSLDEGSSWAEVYGQVGTGNAGESGFATRTIALSSHAGRTARFRFVYEYQGPGTYYPQTTSGVGWYVDDIEFRDLERLGVVGSPREATGGTIAFEPSAEGAYLLQARALVFGGYPLEWGPALLVEASGTAPPSLRWIGISRLAGNHLGLDFAVTGASAQSRFELLRAVAGDSNWTWEPVAGATAQVLVPDREYRFQLESSSHPHAGHLYRVRIP